jgi:hypothetical protein
MLRYYAIATVIVLAVAVLATAWEHRDLIRIRIGSTNLPVSPRPAGRMGAAEGTSGAFRGDAPWALSALPECLQQISKSTGPLSYVESKLPPGSSRVPPGSSLLYGNCTIFVRDAELSVRRGPDRLRVPPHVTLYRAGGELALLRRSGATGELRVYVPTVTTPK